MKRHIVIAVLGGLLLSGCNAGAGSFFGGLFNFGGGSSEEGSTVIAAESLETSATTHFSNAARVANPEPSSLALFGGGLAAMAGFGKRRRKS